MIVLDCSAAVNIVIGTTEGHALLSLMHTDEAVIAPDFLRVELRNVFWKYAHSNVDTKKALGELLSDAEELITQFVPAHALFNESFDAAIKYDHPFYDMLYLCLARRHSATLFTLDKRLMATCAEARVDHVALVDL